MKSRWGEGQPQTLHFVGAGGASYGSVTMRSVGTVQALSGLSLHPEQQSWTLAAINSIHYIPWGEYDYNTFNYAAITTVYEVSHNQLLGFVALERHTSSGRVYGTTGLAKSTDRRVTWDCLGEIITPNDSSN